MLAMPGPIGMAQNPILRWCALDCGTKVLAEPRPNPALQSLTGAYLFASAMALAATNRVAQATQRLEELNALARPRCRPDATAGFTFQPTAASASGAERSRKSQYRARSASSRCRHRHAD